MKFRIPFSGRSINYTEEEIQVVTEAMQTATPLTQGRYLKEFEEKFSRHIKTPPCFALCNASGASAAFSLCIAATGRSQTGHYACGGGAISCE